MPCRYFSAAQISKKLNDAILGFAAGVMLSAPSFSLTVPTIEVAHDQFGGRVIPAAVAAIRVSLGVFFLAKLNERVPNEHFFQGRQGPQTTLARVWLFVLAITLHNLPEGLAVGVGFGGGDAGAMTLAIGIGLQNLPEGLAVALPCCPSAT